MFHFIKLYMNFCLHISLRLVAIVSESLQLLREVQKERKAGWMESAGSIDT